MSADRRILGIDFGTKRVGLALSDPMGIIATGIGTLANDEQLLPEISRIVAERSVIRIVIGMPLTLRGESGDAAVMVHKFIERLREAVPTEIVTLDERFTSSIAEQTIRDMGVSKKKRQDKAKVDEIAAVILLQDYLGSAASRTPLP